MVTERLSEKDGGSRPVPDPTVLTTAALQREVVTVRELMKVQFEGYEKAISLLQAQADKVPSIAVIEERVIAQGKIVDEKFRSIAIQFSERDTRTEQTSRDSKVAVDAALQAAKEAVAEQNKSSALAIAKSEAATAKQIDQLGVAFSATTSGITDKIDDIKDRIATLERAATGIVGQVSGRHETWGSISGVIGVIGIIIAAFIGVLAFLMKP
jgi:hypothetical protein